MIREVMLFSCSTDLFFCHFENRCFAHICTQAHTQTSQHCQMAIQSKTDYTQANEMEKERTCKEARQVLSTYFMISCLEFSQLLKISCLSWSLSCLEWPSVIFTHKLTVLMDDKCHFIRLFRRHLRSCNKQWHFLDSSTLTPANTITLCLCYYG